MTETFGPEYVRPQNKRCPGCTCCVEALCVRGRACVQECAGLVEAAFRQRVSACPCSAEATPGTLAWRAAMVRSVTFATERPLRKDLETLLDRIAEGAALGDLGKLLPKLTVRRYVAYGEGGEPVLTDFGWAYLRARGGGRRTAAVTVTSVDVVARTAEVLVPAFSAEQPVTVPMDQVLTSRTGLTVETAPGATLYAEVNADALRAEHVVLTRVHDPAAAAAVRPEGVR